MRAREMRSILFCLLPALLLAPTLGGQTAPDSLTPVCAPVPGGGSTTSAPPTLLVTLFDRWHEAWLGSPAVADLDGDGSREILAARDQKLLGWSAAGAIVFDETAPAGRIWSSPVVGELVPASPGLEVAAASRATLHLWSAAGNPIAPFPVTWRDELRSLAAGEIDGDAALELVVATTSRLEANGQRDLLMAYELNGAVVTGFPPNTSGASGCVTDCNITGGFDQNLALGDLDGDGVADIVAPHDNAYLSIHDQDGWMLRRRGPLPGRRQGRRRPLPARPRARAAGLAEQHAASTTRRTSPTAPRRSPTSTATARTSSSSWVRCRTPRRPTACRASACGCSATTARVAPAGRRRSTSRAISAGCGISGGNIVGITNQVSIGDLDPPSSGLEIVFAGFDGRIYAVRRDRSIAWSYAYTNDASVFTGGVALADLSGDGRPEVIFNTYSSDSGKGKLFVLGPDGALQHQIPLPDRGAMPVPTVADVDGGGDGTLEIVVSLKDGVDHVRQLLVYTVPGSAENCLPWPTGRGNYLRNGFSAFLPAAPLFADGFESGNLTAWSASTP